LLPYPVPRPTFSTELRTTPPFPNARICDYCHQYKAEYHQNADKHVCFQSCGKGNFNNCPTKLIKGHPEETEQRRAIVEEWKAGKDQWDKRQKENRDKVADERHKESKDKAEKQRVAREEKEKHILSSGSFKQISDNVLNDKQIQRPSFLREKLIEVKERVIERRAGGESARKRKADKITNGKAIGDMVKDLFGDNATDEQAEAVTHKFNPTTEKKEETTSKKRDVEVLEIDDSDEEAVEALRQRLDKLERRKRARVAQQHDLRLLFETDSWKQVQQFILERIKDPVAFWNAAKGILEGQQATTTTTHRGNDQTNNDNPTARACNIANLLNPSY